jgi:hypothetical protein
LLLLVPETRVLKSHAIFSNVTTAEAKSDVLLIDQYKTSFIHQKRSPSPSQWFLHYCPSHRYSKEVTLLLSEKTNQTGKEDGGTLLKN